MGIIEIFFKPVFWMLMGALYAFIFFSASLWAKDIGLKMNWWKWTITAIWFGILSLSIAGGFTLIGENEVTPGIYFLGTFLVLSIILGVLLWRVLSVNKKRTTLKQSD